MRCIEAANGAFDFRLLNLILSAIASRARRKRDRVRCDVRDLDGSTLGRNEFGKAIGSLFACTLSPIDAVHSDSARQKTNFAERHINCGQERQLHLRLIEALGAARCAERRGYAT